MTDQHADYKQAAVTSNYHHPLAQAFRFAADNSIREMLSRWVSELEPVVVWPKFGGAMPVGLTAAGHSKIYVHAGPMTPRERAKSCLT